MATPKRRRDSDARFNRGQPARKSTEVQPVKPEEDVVLETYEQSPERPGGDERNVAPTTPDGPMPDRELASPD